VACAICRWAAARSWERALLEHAAAIEAQRAIDAVERGWRREIGAARYDTMKQVLRQLGRDQTG
jgi:hypothetical protein